MCNLAAVPAPPPPKVQRTLSPRMSWCRGWSLNAHIIAAGKPPNPHAWPTPLAGVAKADERCELCRRTRLQLRVMQANETQGTPPARDGGKATARSLPMKKSAPKKAPMKAKMPPMKGKAPPFKM